MGFCLGSGLFVLFLWEEAGVASVVCRELGGSLFVVLCLLVVCCSKYLEVGVLGGSVVAACLSATVVGAGVGLGLSIFVLFAFCDFGTSLFVSIGFVGANSVIFCCFWLLLPAVILVLLLVLVWSVVVCLLLFVSMFVEILFRVCVRKPMVM